MKISRTIMVNVMVIFRRKWQEMLVSNASLGQREKLRRSFRLYQIRARPLSSWRMLSALVPWSKSTVSSRILAIGSRLMIRKSSASYVMSFASTKKVLSSAT